MNYSHKLEQLSWELVNDSITKGRMKIRPDKPFLWASGYYMPIYNDNRQILIDPRARALVKEAFEFMIYHHSLSDINIIAGTSTSGISPATTLADSLRCPLIYVREKPKDHGLKNRIEGIAEDKDLDKRKVLLIEDVISTGGSSASAVQAIRDANGSIDWCFAIFDYGFDMARAVFEAREPYTKEEILMHPCNTDSIINYEKLLGSALKSNTISHEQWKMLDEWRADPFNWGEKRGFPRVLKK